MHVWMIVSVKCLVSHNSTNLLLRKSEIIMGETFASSLWCHCSPSLNPWYCGFSLFFLFLCTPLLAHIICLPVNLFSLNPVSYLSSLNHNLTQYSPSLHTLTSILQIRSGSHSDALHIGHHKGTIGSLICLNRVTLCRHNGHSNEVQQISMRAQQTWWRSLTGGDDQNEFDWKCKVIIISVSFIFGSKSRIFVICLYYQVNLIHTSRLPWR